MTTSNGTCGGPKNCTIFARIARQRLLRPTSVHIEPDFTPAELLADRLSQLPDGPDPGVTDVDHLGRHPGKADGLYGTPDEVLDGNDLNTGVGGVLGLGTHEAGCPPPARLHTAL